MILHVMLSTGPRSSWTLVWGTKSTQQPFADAKDPLTSRLQDHGLTFAVPWQNVTAGASGPGSTFSWMEVITEEPTGTSVIQVRKLNTGFVVLGYPVTTLGRIEVPPPVLINACVDVDA